MARKATKKGQKQAATRQEPEVDLNYALEQEFRRALCPEATLEQVHDDYLSWVEEVEELIERFGEKTTVAEILSKME